MRFAARLVVGTFVAVIALSDVTPAGAQLSTPDAHSQLFPSFTNRLYPTNPPVIVVSRKVDVAFAERVQYALVKPVTINASGPLQDVLGELFDPLGLPWHIHRKSFEEAGVAPDVAVDLKLSNVSLNTALDAVLGPLDLDWCLNNETITIASEETVSVSYELRAYPVGDIVAATYDDGTTRDDYDPLIEIITSNIQPNSWDEVGGPGSIKEFGLSHALVIGQTGRVHEQISRLLTAIRQAKGAQLRAPSRDATVRLLSSEHFIKPAQNVTGAIVSLLPTSDSTSMETPVIEVLPPHEIVVRAQLRTLLDRKYPWRTETVTLRDLVTRLAEATGAPWRVDQKALEEAGLSDDCPIELPAHEFTLRAALRQMLAERDLTFVIRGEAFLITTPEKASAQLEGRVYYVGDLVQWPGHEADGRDYDSLIEVITSLVQPTTWDEVGGPGSLREFDYAQSLIFCQTQDAHDEIELLLAALRMSRAFADGKFSLPSALAASPNQPTAPATPRRGVHINNQQPQWRLPRVHN